MRPLSLGLLLVVLAGCSGPLVRNAPDLDTPADFPDHSAAQIIHQVTQSLAAITAFSSEARVQIESPGFSQSVSASLRASLADSVYASLRGPFSLRVGRGLVTADSFFAHDQLNRKLYLGALHTADRYVPGAGEPGALAQTLIGHLVPDPGVAWSVVPDSARYVLTEPGGGMRRRYTIDPALWRVVVYEELAPEGTVLSRRTFAAFDVIDSLVAPRQVTLARPPEGSTVTIEHQRLTLNPETLSFPFEPPTDVERIEL